MKVVQNIDEQITNCPFCNIVRDKNSTYGYKVASFSVDIYPDKQLVHPSFSVIKCSNCFLMYKSAIPRIDDLYLYYSNLDSGYENVKDLFPTDRIITEHFNKKTQSCTILDYGCGTGRILSKLDIKDKCYGIDINQSAMEIAQKKGIIAINEKDLKLNYKDFFDSIILSDVYEHLTSPKELLELLLYSLKPGGELIISTGISDLIRYKKRIGYYWYFQLYSHLQMASNKHIDWIGKTFSLSILLKRHVSHYDRTLSIRFKKLFANLIFYAYHELNLKKVLPEIFNVKKWHYPIFDNYAEDHIVCIYKKS